MIGDILQPTHLLFILVVALLVLGPKRLPEAGRALGKGIRDFRSAIGGEEDRHGAIPPDATAAPPQAYATAAPAPPPPVATAAPAPPQPTQTPEQPTETAEQPTETAEQPTETVHPVG